MTSPLYSVGQHVAVCTRCLTIVIPATTVTARRFDPAGFYHNPVVGEYWAEDGWAYQIAGRKCWFSEPALRPIQPGEYLSDSAPQKLEQLCE